MQLPLQQTQVRDLSLLSTKWKSILDPLIANPMNSIIVLRNVHLVIGTNVINHLLGQMQQGWTLTDIQAGAVIYRNADFNSLTLSLSSSANVTVNIGVF